LLLSLCLPAAAGTYTAATCNQSDVNAVINGPTHTAVDGDVINVPSGSCTWSSAGVTVPGSIGITIIGSGSPQGGGTTFGSACSSTNITITGVTAFVASPTYGNSTMRLSCMTWTYGSGSSIGFSMLGTCTSSGCPSLRLDNITFSNWAGHSSAGISYGINAVGNMFGSIDHNTINGVTGNYLQLVEFSHANYLAVGSYGDNPWSLSESYGTANFLFIENNVFNTAGCCENEGTAGGLTNQGGGRVVVRFNQFTAMDNLNFAMGWHGTESSGRPRSTRTFEFYGNTWTVTSGTPQVAGARGGTGVAWGNTLTASGGAMCCFFTLSTYRAGGNTGGWGACDGSTVYDGNDGTTYYSGTIGSYNAGTYTITASGSPGWTTNQWSPAGAPYSVHDVTQNNGWEISANGSGTLTLNSALAGGPGSWTPAPGDSIQILRATWCLDQAAGRGAGILYSGSTATPASSANEVLSPSYFWSNPSPSPAFGFIDSDTLRVINGRDYYTENVNQTAQTSATSPFDGTTTIGFGHGTLARRPTTCTTGVGYFATDQGSWNISGNTFGNGVMYLCTSTNTWTSSYTPYTYPHPLDSGGAAGGQSLSGVTLSGVSKH
jgi:hypothetical protein